MRKVPNKTLKKLIAMLVVSTLTLVPTVALAQGPTDEPVCACKTLCDVRENANTDCAVCGVDFAGCEGLEVPEVSEVITTTPSLTLQGELRALEEYSTEDINAMNKIIEEHPELELTKFEEGDTEPPEDWTEVVTWSDEGESPRNIIALMLSKLEATDDEQDEVNKMDLLGKLDVSDLKNLRELYCDNTGVGELDVSQNTALTHLSCDGTNLTALDVSKNAALAYLSCNKTQVADLDLSNKTALTYLSCSYTSLENLDLRSCTELEELFCDSKGLETLDVSKNTQLKKLTCNGAGVSALDISKNAALEELYCDGTEINVLDVSKNTELIILSCNGSKVSELNVSYLTNLKELYCNSTGVSTLDVSQNAKLTHLSCNSTSVSALDLKKNENLSHLDCSTTPISELDVSENISLEQLDCHSTEITELNVSANTELTDLDCYETKLNVLDVSQNTKLGWLSCDNTEISELDVRKNEALSILTCNNTQLKDLDVSRNTWLETLYCHNTQLSELDVSNNAALKELYCYNNPQLSKLNLNNENLEWVFCSGNPVRTLITKTGQLNLPAGTVLGVPGDINPKENKNYGYDVFTNIVTLTATPVAGKSFVMWKPSPAVAWENGSTHTDKQVSFKLTGEVTMALWYEYEILSAPATYTGGVDGVTFSVNGELSDYVKTTVNDADVAATAKAGSTVITLPTSYLKTLQEGTYNVQALYTDGYAKTTLTVKKLVEPTKHQSNPKTGDDSNQLLYLVLCMIAGVAILGTATYRRNKAR
ncbi:hypothetical protein NK118_03440 [Lachnospiraceae bacterium PAL227]|uniref:Uncharacterized protein n=1 Tax=Ohessyouella blattaphilus TaxID=2949333 RepID=A0ABT1EF22_9FIRM|nr:hypothetical protein [Ohessyouella blattaphilus]MCP1109301.1 hypothetical protein [Ohessyouella blattaphilus]MCR8562695.1 hypothetical protein [Ohessyouella blattaphilus]